MEVTKNIKTDIQSIISRIPIEELDCLQKEIQQIKEERKKEELKEIVIELNNLLSQLDKMIDNPITIEGYDWISEGETEVEISIGDLIPIFRQFLLK